LLARDLQYIDEKTYKEMVVSTDEIGKMLNGLIKRIGS
jgi:four helix bundle protein